MQSLQSYHELPASPQEVASYERGCQETKSLPAGTKREIAVFDIQPHLIVGSTVSKFALNVLQAMVPRKQVRINSDKARDVLKQNGTVADHGPI